MSACAAAARLRCAAPRSGSDSGCDRDRERRLRGPTSAPRLVVSSISDDLQTCALLLLRERERRRPRAPGFCKGRHARALVNRRPAAAFGGRGTLERSNQAASRDCFRTRPALIRGSGETAGCTRQSGRETSASSASSGIVSRRSPNCKHESSSLGADHETAAPGAIHQCRSTSIGRARLPLRNETRHVAAVGHCNSQSAEIVPRGESWNDAIGVVRRLLSADCGSARLGHGGVLSSRPGAVLGVKPTLAPGLRAVVYGAAEAAATMPASGVDRLVQSVVATATAHVRRR